MGIVIMESTGIARHKWVNREVKMGGGTWANAGSGRVSKRREFWGAHAARVLVNAPRVRELSSAGPVASVISAEFWGAVAAATWRWCPRQRELFFL